MLSASFWYLPPDNVGSDPPFCFDRIWVSRRNPNNLFEVDNHKKPNKRFSYAIKDYAAIKIYGFVPKSTLSGAQRSALSTPANP